MFARGIGREHWDEVMKNQKTHIQKWHKLQVSCKVISYCKFWILQNLSHSINQETF